MTRGIGSGSTAGGSAGPSLLIGLLVLPVAWTTLALSLGWSVWSFIDYVNLPFHEAGHIFFSPFGSTLHILGGTLGELLVPALLCVYFLVKDRRPPGAAFCFGVGLTLTTHAERRGVKATTFRGRETFFL